MEQFEHLSPSEIQQKLAEVERQHKELQRLFEVQKEAGKRDFAQEIRDLIEQRGYEVEEIALLLQKRPRRAMKSATQYIDPENSQNIYTRGPVPAWFKESMKKHGMDPSSKEQREQFKHQHLIKQSA